MSLARDIADIPDSLGDATFQKNIKVGTTTNLLSNAEFTTNTTGWAATTATLAIVSNELQLTPDSGANGFANQQVDNLVIGASYVASVTVTVDAGSLSRLYIGTSANGNQTVNSINLGTGTHSYTFVATATTHHFALVVGGGTGQVTRFDNAKLTEASRVVFPAATGTAPEIKQGNSVNDLALSTNGINRVLVDNNGHVTMPNQSAFLSDMQGITQDNLGGSVSTTIQFGNEVFDQNADYNTSTYTFTAPVTGRYMLGSNLNYSQWDVSGNYVWMVIVTSNNTWYLDLKNANVITADGYYGQQGCVLADMDANDTAYVAVASSGMANQMDMITGTSSQFFGYLVA